jgi:hypothetical protein
MKMRPWSSCILLIVVSACTASAAYSAEQAVLASGLQHLVDSWDRNDWRLPAQLKQHVTSSAGEPLVRIHLRAGADPEAALRRLAQAGFRLTTRSSINPALIEGYLPLAWTRAAASVEGVQSLHATLRPVKHAGLVQSQAVALEKADLVHARGIDGTGIRLGALSNSFDTCATCITHAADDVASGDLPANGVTVIQDDPGTPDQPTDDEGRAMLQLVHDIAPGAQLAFATADFGQLGFAENILALRAQFHADVIVDDVLYPDEPMYSDGIVAQAVDLVSHSGAAYFSSAGNNGLEAYEAVYQPVSFKEAQDLVAQGHGNVHLEQIPAAIRPRTVHNFGNGDGPATIAQRVTAFAQSPPDSLSFQWDEPFDLGLVKTDYNIYFFDKDGNWLDPNDPNATVLYTTDNNVLSDEAFEFAQLVPLPTDIVGGLNYTDYRVVIGNVNGGPARHIKYISGNSELPSERENAPSTWGHATARGARGVAAVYYGIPQFTESFSSPGPVTIYFDELGRRLREPEIRFTPQITAADGVDTTFFSPGNDPDGDGFPNFFGTSAAAPDAAAVATLVLQANGGSGSLTPERVYRRLERTATPIPLPLQRGFSVATAGPVRFDASGDLTRWNRYFGLTVHDELARSVSSVSVNTSTIGLAWNPNPNRFTVGESHGIAPTDIAHTVSPDASTFTVTFAPNTFRSGDSFRFGESVFSPILGRVNEDPDVLRGATVTVTLSDGSVFTSKVLAAPPRAINPYAGFGLVNADRATRMDDED